MLPMNASNTMLTFFTLLTCANDFSDPIDLHPVSSDLEKSGIRVAVGDWSVTEPRRWRPL